MFGFEDSKPSQLEQLCINLSSETMQHFYNTHIFKSSIESCREEGIASDVVIDYIDNVPCIDLISSLVSFQINHWTQHLNRVGSTVCFQRIWKKSFEKPPVFMPYFIWPESCQISSIFQPVKLWISFEWAIPTLLNWWTSITENWSPQYVGCGMLRPRFSSHLCAKSQSTT